MKHVHRYERRRLGSWKKSGHEIYKCATVGCNHYMVDIEMVVGRYSLCWGLEGAGSCDELVEMTRYLVYSERRKRPLCDKCKKKKQELREKLKEEQEKQTEEKQQENNDVTINS